MTKTADASSVYRPDPFNNLPNLNQMNGLPQFGHIYQGWTQSPPAFQPQSNPADSFIPHKAGTAQAAHVIGVLDESGSMNVVWDQTISAWNEFVEGQKADVQTSGIPTFVTLIKFDGGNVTVVYSRVNVLEVQPLTRDTYQPRGGTNLLDAMGGAMMNINTELGQLAEDNRPIVTLVALTDGDENSSRTFDNSAIKQMVEKAEAQNWGFIFLGANIDAFSVGGALGFRQDNTLSFSASNIEASLGGATRMANSMKGAYARGLSTDEVYMASAFTDAERKSAKED